MYLWFVWFFYSQDLIDLNISCIKNLTCRPNNLYWIDYTGLPQAKMRSNHTLWSATGLLYKLTCLPGSCYTIQLSLDPNSGSYSRHIWIYTLTGKSDPMIGCSDCIFIKFIITIWITKIHIHITIIIIINCRYRPTITVIKSIWYKTSFLIIYKNTWIIIFFICNKEIKKSIIVDIFPDTHYR